MENMLSTVDLNTTNGSSGRLSVVWIQQGECTCDRQWTAWTCVSRLTALRPQHVSVICQFQCTVKSFRISVIRCSFASSSSCEVRFTAFWSVLVFSTNRAYIADVHISVVVVTESTQTMGLSLCRRWLLTSIWLMAAATCLTGSDVNNELNLTDNEYVDTDDEFRDLFADRRSLNTFSSSSSGENWYGRILM